MWRVGGVPCVCGRVPTRSYFPFLLDYLVHPQESSSHSCPLVTSIPNSTIHSLSTDEIHACLKVTREEVRHLGAIPRPPPPPVPRWLPPWAGPSPAWAAAAPSTPSSRWPSSPPSSEPCSLPPPPPRPGAAAVRGVWPAAPRDLQGGRGVRRLQPPGPGLPPGGLH